MPRAKKTAPKPKVLGVLYEGILKIPIVEITEETENIGKGAKQKVENLKNFEKAHELIADEYFFGSVSQKKKIKELIYGNRKISAFRDELQRRGINLEDRACGTLAEAIQKSIIAFDNAIKNKKGTS